MLQQVFNTLEDDQPIRTDVDDDELFGDEGDSISFKHCGWSK